MRHREGRTSKEKDPLNIITYNVGGLLAIIQYVEHAVSRLNASVGIITETWIDESSAIPLSWPSKHTIGLQTISNVHRDRNFAPRGGVSLIFTPMLRYRVLRKVTHKNFQMMSVSTMGIILIGAYISPYATSEDF